MGSRSSFVDMGYYFDSIAALLLRYDLRPSFATDSKLTLGKVISILALQLDQQVRSTSTYGPKIEEITRLSPTVYPILFAMIAARFYKNAARWNLERPGGIAVSSLEQIVGSSSFASALERLFIIRTQLLLGAFILLTWAMSPLGGQSSSRLLRVEGRRLQSDEWIYYDVRSVSRQRNPYYDMDFFYHGPVDIIKALYSGSLLSPRKQHLASMDLWGRPKIPQWYHDSVEDSGEGDWRVVDKDALETGGHYYTSLIGVNLQGLNVGGNSTTYEFVVGSDYIDVNCSLIRSRASSEDLRAISFARMGKNDSNLEEALDRDPDSSFVSVVGIGRVKSAELSPNPYILYASRGVPFGVANHSVFNCTTDTIKLQTNLVCTTQGCSPRRQRRSRRTLPMSRSQLINRLFSLSNAVNAWPHMTHVRRQIASATENYIANDENVFAEQEFQDWTDVDIKMFSRRLTIAFNTVWEAGKDSYNISKSSLALPEDPTELWTNRTQATVTKTEDAYYVNRTWVAVLMFTTAILQILAFGGLVLRHLIRGPDIIGYASSLTRDNQFASISGGSYLDGAERARSLRDVRVQLGDVRPEDSCGYIALSVVHFPAPTGGDSDRDKGDHVGLGELEKKRTYA